MGVGAFGVVYKGRVKREVVLKTPYAQHCAGGTLMGESIGVAVKTLKEGKAISFQLYFQENEKTGWQKTVCFLGAPEKYSTFLG